MYITIHKKPSKEDITAYNMRQVEEDSSLDYKIDLSSLNQETQKKLYESFSINEEKLNNATNIVLTYHNEI